MVRCGCASDQCSCTVVAGPNVTVSGTGSRTNPYVIEAATQVVGEGGPPETTERMTGEMTMWTGLAAPTGWLLCNGQAVNRAVYADLFTLMGTRFGAGDGSTTFNLPDMTDRFPMGASGTSPLGTKTGTNTRTLTEANLPPHVHTINHDHAQFLTSSSEGVHTHTFAQTRNDADGATSTVKRDGSATGDAAVSASGQHQHTIDVPAHTGNSGSVGSSTPLDIKPALSAVNFIVKT